MGFVAIYDGASGQKLCLVRLPNNEHITALAFNADGSQIAIGTKTRAVYLFDAPAGGAAEIVGLEANTALAHSAPVQALAYSPKGDRLVSGSDDGSIKVWDPHARLEVLGLKTTHREPVRHILYSQDGTRLIAIGQTRGATIFDGAPRSRFAD